MKLWIDDLRDYPSGDDCLWVHAKTSQEAIEYLKIIAGQPSLFTIGGVNYMPEELILEEVSFDHDLGYLYAPTILPDGSEFHADRPDDTRRVMLWMIEYLPADQWPKKIVIHSGNPIGAKWLREMAREYAPEGTEIW